MTYHDKIVFLVGRSWTKYGFIKIAIFLVYSRFDRVFIGAFINTLSNKYERLVMQDLKPFTDMNLYDAERQNIFL